MDGGNLFVDAIQVWFCVELHHFPFSIRARASDHEVISRYFDLLEQTLTANDLTGKPCRSGI